jgi:glycosyltransferase involved in cell wall biosynthesis
VRVLLGIDTWGLVGGTERYAAVVVPALRAAGHEVLVLCREAHPGSFGGELETVPVVALPELDGETMSRAARVQLRQQVRELAPDVVFLQVARNLTALSELVELAPVVRFVHDHTLFCPGLNKYREDGELCERPLGIECLSRYWLSSGCVCFKRGMWPRRPLQPVRVLSAKLREIEINRRAAALVTNSHHMRGELVRAGFDPTRVTALPMFTRSNTPDQPAGPLPEETEAFLAQGDGPVVFTPARLTLPDKGVDYLVSALGMAKGPLRAVVAGTGPAEAWLREKADAETPAGRVHFPGWLDAGGVEALYGRCDLVCIPSVWAEPFGLVGLEAMAHSRPVAAFAVGGVPEWCADGETGLLSPRRDAHALALAIDRLAGEPELRASMGAAGLARVQTEFTPEAHMGALLPVLEGAAGESERPRSRASSKDTGRSARPASASPACSRASANQTRGSR